MRVKPDFLCAIIVLYRCGYQVKMSSELKSAVAFFESFFRVKIIALDLMPDWGLGTISFSSVELIPSVAVGNPFLIKPSPSPSTHT